MVIDGVVASDVPCYRVVQVYFLVATEPMVTPFAFLSDLKDHFQFHSCFLGLLHFASHCYLTCLGDVRFAVCKMKSIQKLSL